MFDLVSKLCVTKLGDVEGMLHIEYEKLSANSLYFSQFFRLLVRSAVTTDLNTSVQCHVILLAHSFFITANFIRLDLIMIPGSSS